MKIVTIGAGYVGLVSGICLADLGHEVVCVDKNIERVRALDAGRVPIYEPGLEEMMKRNVAAGRLQFSGDMAEAVRGAAAVFICVGTPEDPETGRADLSFVLAAARELAGCLEPGAVVVTKSTVPAGTNRLVRETMEKENRDLEVRVASNPEFLREGSAIGDFMEPDRIVVGVEDTKTRCVMEAIYAPLLQKGYPMMVTDLQSAEIIKYASNAFLATKVTFINEIARLCEKAAADVTTVARGMGMDGRIGARFLRAGPGYGGSCFPKDTSALASMGREFGVNMSITEAVIASNRAQKEAMVEKISDLLDGDLSGREIAVFGVTFKPETDDMREAPSLAILPALHAAGARIRIVDPEGFPEASKVFVWAGWCDDPIEAATGADAVVVLTEWKIFQELDLSRVAGVMTEPRLADLRNIYDIDRAREAGFTRYCGVGRPGF